MDALYKSVNIKISWNVSMWLILDGRVTMTSAQLVILQKCSMNQFGQNIQRFGFTSPQECTVSEICYLVLDNMWPPLFGCWSIGFDFLAKSRCLSGKEMVQSSTNWLMNFIEQNSQCSKNNLSTRYGQSYSFESKCISYLQLNPHPPTLKKKNV